jgi:predicted MFS family arabinose efflux permease
MLAIAVDIGLARMGYGLVLPAIRGDISDSYAAFGFVATLHFAGYLLGSLAAPVLLRYDPTARMSAAGSHALVAACLVASAFAISLPQLAAARALMGVACGVGVAAVVTGALERVAPQARAGVSGRIWAGAAVGLILSAPATPWLLAGAGRWRIATLLVAALSAVVAVGLAAAFSARVPDRDAPAVAETPFRLRDLLDAKRYLLLTIAYVGFGAAYTAYSTFIVAALRTQHLSTVQIALVWSAYGIAAFAGAMYVGRLVAGRFRLIAFALALGVAAVGSLLGALPSVAAAIVGALGVGLGLAASPAIASALARSRSSAATGAAAFVAVTTIMSVGQIVGPLAAGAAADRFGAAIVPLVAFAIYAAATGFALLDGSVQQREAVLERLRGDGART